MCGYTGIINLKNQGVNLTELAAMTEAINHRGPDDTGIVVYSNREATFKEFKPSEAVTSLHGYNCGVGFKRLSIFDLSESGHQPMVDYKNGVIIAFNGGIFNAFEYKSLLESKGFAFRSKTDTEIILYLYQLLGFERMLEKLNGMFALCIIDLKRKTTYIARDRMGIKPMYYHNNGDTFIFGSEVKTFLYHNGFKAELDYSKLDEYTRFEYIAGDETLLKNVHALQPGHYIEVNPDGIQIRKYWEIYNGDQVLDIGFEEAKGWLEEKLGESLQLQLLGDVKIGCQLSGSIGSSLIAMLAADTLKSRNAGTVSVIPHNQHSAEEQRIDYALGKIGIEGHKFILSTDYYVDNFAKAVWHFDFPLFSPTALGALLLAERSRDYFTVFLSGDGADELLVGPPHLLNSMQNRGKGDGNSKDFSAADLYINASAHFNFDLLMQMKPDFRLDSTAVKRKEIFDSGNGSFVRKSQRYELSTTLMDLLMRHEKMTMAQSMENRVPFLDHNVVDFARRLPDKYLVQNGLSQNGGAGIILKGISEKYFGKEFSNATSAGLEIPLTDIYGNRDFRSWVLDTIVPGIRERGIYNASLVEKHFSHLPAMSQHEGASAWALISFETWARLFLDKISLPAV